MSKYPDHSKEINRINRIMGQLEGVKNMIVEGAYCPDILVQTKAAQSAIRSLEAVILESHIRHCLVGAARSGEQTQVDIKIEELLKLYKKS